MTPLAFESCLREHPDGCSLAVRAQPGARRTAISGIYGEGNSAALKITLQTPAIEGRANEALIAFLAGTLLIPRARIHIVHGEHDRFKLVVLRGLDVTQVREKILAAI